MKQGCYPLLPIKKDQTNWTKVYPTSPIMHIISHAKGTYFPLARIMTMIPPYHLWDNPADLVTEGPAQWLSPSLLALEGFPILRGAGHYTLFGSAVQNQTRPTLGEAHYSFVFIFHTTELFNIQAKLDMTTPKWFLSLYVLMLKIRFFKFYFVQKIDIFQNFVEKCFIYTFHSRILIWDLCAPMKSASIWELANSTAPKWFETLNLSSQPSTQKKGGKHPINNLKDMPSQHQNPHNGKPLHG